VLRRLWLRLLVAFVLWIAFLAVMWATGVLG
jgi:hypothetical protein